MTEDEKAKQDNEMMNGLLDSIATDSIADKDFIEHFSYIWMQIIGDIISNCTSGTIDAKINLIVKDKFKDEHKLSSNLFRITRMSCGETGVTYSNELYLTFQIAGEPREFHLSASDIDIEQSSIETLNNTMLPLHWCISAILARVQFRQHTFVDVAKLPCTVTEVKGNVITADFSKGRK